MLICLLWSAYRISPINGYTNMWLSYYKGFKKYIKFLVQSSCSKIVDSSQVRLVFTWRCVLCTENRKEGTLWIYFFTAQNILSPFSFRAGECPQVGGGRDWNVVLWQAVNYINHFTGKPFPSHIVLVINAVLVTLL